MAITSAAIAQEPRFECVCGFVGEAVKRLAITDDDARV
jgi:hypothetical protein